MRIAWKPVAVGLWLAGSVALLVVGGMTDSLFGVDPPSAVPQHKPPAQTTATAAASPVPAASAAPPAQVPKEPATTAAPESPKPVASRPPSVSTTDTALRPVASPPVAAPASPPAQDAATPKSSAPPSPSPPVVVATPAAASPNLPADQALSDDQRRQVQMALQRRGYDPGPVDGVFGPLTRGAIRRFQQAIGAASTGVLTADEASWLVTTVAEAARHAGG